MSSPSEPSSASGHPLDPSRDYHPETAGRIAAMAFAALLIFPIRDLVNSHPPTVRLVLVLAGVAAFVAVYTWRFVLATTAAQSRPGGATWLSLVVAAGLVVVLVMGDDPKRWAVLFIFIAAAIGVRIALPWAAYGIAACTVLSVAALLPVAPSENTTAVALQTLAMGALTVGMGRLRAVINELHEARDQVAQLAVAEERLRFARDLHDLLGHSLSVIALKADFAQRLLPDQVERAAGEVADIDAVARQALAEVRQAVSGYRQPTLPEAVATGRQALEAAGIEVTYQIADVALPPTLDAALAWVLREGVTNVLRHSRARHCWITITAGLVDASVEVADDGVGGPTPSAGEATLAQPASIGGEPASIGAEPASIGAEPASKGAGPAPTCALPPWAGNGLSGLAERVEALHGHVALSPRPGGGFHLQAWIPTTASLTAATKP